VSLSKQNKLDDVNWAAKELKSIAPNFSLNDVNEMLPIHNEGIIMDIHAHLRLAGL